MKKLILIFSIFLFLSFTLNITSAVAQPKTYSQGFYTLKDLGLKGNTSYSIQNHEPYTEGLLFAIDSDKKIQQTIRIPADSTIVPLTLHEGDYNFIIYGDVNLTFS